MPLSKDDFEYIERELSCFFGRVELLIQGYKVSLAMERQSAFRSVVMTYVNGKFLGEWVKGKCPESDFMCPVKSFVYDAKMRKRMKAAPKKVQKLMEFTPDRQITVYSPTWKSFRTLFAHLKQFEDIQLIRKEESSNE